MPNMKMIYLFAVMALSLSAAASQLPFSETFDTLGQGPVNTQNGWTNLSGTATIQSNVFASGSQAMQIQTGSVTHALSSSGTSVWVSFQARITAAPDIYPVVTNANASVAFFVNTNLHLVVYSNQTPIQLNIAIQTNTWTRFDVFCDYSNLKWTLSVNGTNAAGNLGLYSASSQIESLLIASDNPDPVYFDELAVQDTEPAAGNTDTDGDGIPDWWEQRYFGGITNIAANAVGSNGLTHLQTYIAGLNPEDANDLFKITQSTGRKFNWVRKPSRQYDIYWTTNLISSFTYIYTAAGNEFEDTDAGRTEKPSGFYQIRVRK
jgi:hypothetical protein